MPLVSAAPWASGEDGVYTPSHSAVPTYPATKHIAGESHQREGIVPSSGAELPLVGGGCGQPARALWKDQCGVQPYFIYVRQTERFHWFVL